jgi:hypothetical protein
LWTRWRRLLGCRLEWMSSTSPDVWLLFQAFETRNGMFLGCFVPGPVANERHFFVGWFQSSWKLKPSGTGRSGPHSELIERGLKVTLILRYVLFLEREYWSNSLVYIPVPCTCIIDIARFNANMWQRELEQLLTNYEGFESIFLFFNPF